MESDTFKAVKSFQRVLKINSEVKKIIYVWFESHLKPRFLGFSQGPKIGSYYDKLKTHYSK